MRTSQQQFKVESPQSAGALVARSLRAFTLVEIMVAVTLMTIILLGLTLMFNQTQKAFKTGVTQVDVLEAGRMATDLLTREVEQVTPSNRTNVINFLVDNPFSPPVPLALPGASVLRTNVLNELYFLTRRNQEWIGIGYKIYPTNTGVGTLYRFQQSTNLSADPYWLYNNFTNAAWYPTNTLYIRPLLDGIVQFRVRAYDTNGIWITEQNWRTNSAEYFKNNTYVQDSGIAPGEIAHYEFYNNVLPASLDLELGVLEPQTLARYRSIPDPVGQSNFLATQSAYVHLFRQRINVRNVDRKAYQ